MWCAVKRVYCELIIISEDLKQYICVSYIFHILITLLQSYLRNSHEKKDEPLLHVSVNKTLDLTVLPCRCVITGGICLAVWYDNTLDNPVTERQNFDKVSVAPVFRLCYRIVIVCNMYNDVYNIDSWISHFAAVIN